MDSMVLKMNGILIEIDRVYNHRRAGFRNFLMDWRQILINVAIIFDHGRERILLFR